MVSCARDMHMATEQQEGWTRFTWAVNETFHSCEKSENNTKITVFHGG
jgi:hypothetical protein